MHANETKAYLQHGDWGGPYQGYGLRRQRRGQLGLWAGNRRGIIYLWSG